jgi:hypothetical protein
MNITTEPRFAKVEIIVGNSTQTKDDTQTKYINVMDIHTITPDPLVGYMDAAIIEFISGKPNIIITDSGDLDI